MAVAHVATGAVVSAAAATTISIVSPAGAVDDLLVFAWMHDDYSDGEETPISPPITLIKVTDGSPQLGDDSRQFIYVGKEDQAAGRSFSFGTLGASEEHTGVCVRYSGQDLTTPVQAGSFVRAPGPSIFGASAATFGGMFISFISTDNSLAGSSPTDWTQRAINEVISKSLLFSDKVVDQYPLPQVIDSLSNGITGSSTGDYISGTFVIAPAETSRTLTGVTKDKDGNALGSCEVALFKEIGGTPPDYQFVASTTSDGSGNYSFTIKNDNDAKFMAFSIKDDTPHVFDATDNVLQPT